MKRLTILGATGSIGNSTLRVVDAFPDRFAVIALGAGRNIDLLRDQILRYRPRAAAVLDGEKADALKKSLPPDIRTEILHGPQGYETIARMDEADVVVGAMMGAAGLKPTLAAIDAGKTIALANKETLVMAGERVMALAAERRVSILPVDSEHSAIFQCLNGERRADLKQVLLTASGGPFFNNPETDFSAITPEEALRHPNWRMGPKISIDSATLMNKGLEVIEARWLFGLSADQIRVVVHPQSIIHSMVVFRDGSILAQMGAPDMRGPIAYALSYPERLPLDLPVPDFPGLGALTFQEPDMRRFPCLALALSAAEAGATFPAVLNAANEAAVEAFLQKRIGFTDSARIIQGVLDHHQAAPRPSLSDILDADGWARSEALARIGARD